MRCGAKGKSLLVCASSGFVSIPDDNVEAVESDQKKIEKLLDFRAAMAASRSETSAMIDWEAALAYRDSAALRVRSAHHLRRKRSLADKWTYESWNGRRHHNEHPHPRVLVAQVKKAGCTQWGMFARTSIEPNQLIMTEVALAVVPEFPLAPGSDGDGDGDGDRDGDRDGDDEEVLGNSDSDSGGGGGSFPWPESDGDGDSDGDDEEVLGDSDSDSDSDSDNGGGGGGGGGGNEEAVLGRCETCMVDFLSATADTRRAWNQRITCHFCGCHWCGPACAEVRSRRHASVEPPCTRLPGHPLSLNS